MKLKSVLNRKTYIHVDLLLGKVSEINKILSLFLYAHARTLVPQCFLKLSAWHCDFVICRTFEVVRVTKG